MATPATVAPRRRPSSLAVGLVVLLAAGWADAQRLRAGDLQADPPRHNVAFANADGSWRPSAAQREAIEAITRSFLAARDANKVEEAYAFVSPRPEHDMLPPVNFQRMLTEFNAKAGAVKARRLRTVTWYKDTPQAGPGLYVAVDFSSDFTNLALHCGYVVWNEQPDGSFFITRMEENQISIAMMAKLTTADVARVRAAFRC